MSASSTPPAASAASSNPAASAATRARPSPRPSGALAVAALIAFGSLGVALFTQHALDMQPCSWCVAQRLAIAVAGILALLGALLGQRPIAAQALAVLTAAAAAAGLAAAVWQQGWASKSLSCAYTLADRIMMKSGLAEALPAVFQATASCAEANQALLGLPYAVWSALAFAAIALAALAALRRAVRLSARPSVPA